MNEPILKRYTVTMEQKVAISAESPAEAVALSQELLSGAWAMTAIDAREDY